MLSLVVGGAASGKSAGAEALVLRSPAVPRIYIATMQVWDEESRLRVQKHRAMRAQKQFDTLEAPTGLLAAAEKVPPGACVLLEDLTNLCANEMFSPEGAAAEAFDAILAGVQALAAQCEDFVIVSGELTSGGTEYEGETLEYLKTLARLNNTIAAMAGRVYEAAAGVMIRHK